MTHKIKESLKPSESKNIRISGGIIINIQNNSEIKRVFEILVK